MRSIQYPSFSVKVRGFTLIELLVVIGILSLLAAIIFPVFSRSRASSAKSQCLSNVRQIGQAIMLYCQDYDDVFPLGGDPGDIYTTGWVGTPWEAVMNDIQPLPEVMTTYVKNRDIWRCPADTGFDKTGQFENVLLDGRPSSFEKFGMSYAYNSYLAADQERLSGLVAYDTSSPYAEHGVSDIPLSGDPVGFWHGGNERVEKRYNYVFCDGHAQSINRDQADKMWRMSFSKP